MLSDMARRALEMAAQLSALAELNICVLDMAGGEFLDKRAPEFCLDCGACDCAQACEYGGREAFRWNGTYVFFCKAGLAFAATALSERDALRGCLFAGPMLLGQRREDALTQIQAPLVRLAEKLPLYSAARLSGYLHVADVCARDACAQSVGAATRVPDGANAPGISDQAEQQYARKLKQAIARGDRIGAQKLLNDILGEMYFSGNLDVNTLKARALRLTSMFAQCCAPGFFRAKDEYAREIERFDDIDALNVWLGELTRGFVCYAFNFTPSVNADALFKARRYVREHISDKIALEDVAEHVHLSRAYVSSMFRQQTGEGLFEYILRMRLDKACQMLCESDAPLCDVAAACGFDDQSYFTKAFRKARGVPPGAYRKAARQAAHGC